MYIGQGDLSQFTPGAEAFSSPTCSRLERRLWQIIRQDITWTGNEGFHEMRPYAPYLKLEQGLLNLSGEKIESVILTRPCQMPEIIPNVTALINPAGGLNYFACVSPVDGIYSVRRPLVPDTLPEFDKLIQNLDQIFLPFIN